MRFHYVDGVFTELPPTSMEVCRALIGTDEEFAIEAAADYDETSLGCEQARAMYGLTRGVQEIALDSIRAIQ